MVLRLLTRKCGVLDAEVCERVDALDQKLLLSFGRRPRCPL